MQYAKYRQALQNVNTFYIACTLTWEVHERDLSQLINVYDLSKFL